MKRTPLVVVAVLAAVSVAIILASPRLSSAANSGLNIAHEKASGLLHRLSKDLQESRLTNVKLVPNSLLVQANNKSGNPVTMFITPNSMAEITIHTKSGNPETMFITPKSMAEVPTTRSSNRL